MAEKTFFGACTRASRSLPEEMRHSRDEVENKNVGRNPFGRAQPTTTFNTRTRRPVFDLWRFAATVSITAEEETYPIGNDRSGNMDHRRRS